MAYSKALFCRGWLVTEKPLIYLDLLNMSASELLLSFLI